MLDVEYHLTLHEQRVVEHQLVLRDVDRAFDRVLDRNEAEVGLAGLDGCQDIRHRTLRQQLSGGKVGLEA